jgi:Fe2+ transport system protein FeoA
MQEGTTRSLAELAPADRGRFVRLSGSDPAMLRYLHERGVRLGDRLDVLDRQPFDGPLTVRLGDRPQVVDLEADRVHALDPARRLAGKQARLDALDSVRSA